MYPLKNQGKVEREKHDGVQVERVDLLEEYQGGCYAHVACHTVL